MTMAETAELAVKLSLDESQFTRGINNVDKRVGHVGSSLKSALGVGVKVAAGVAAAGIGLLTVNLKEGIDALKKDAVVTAQTEAVLKSTGQAAGLSAKQIADLADKYSMLDGVQDDVVQSAENVLLRFTNIKANAFEPATKAALDFAAATGTDASSAAKLLGRALNDPIRGMSFLRRAGISLDASTETRIKGLVKQGKLYEAQKILLKEIAKRYGGVAKAQADADPSRRLGVAVEKLQKALAKGLLPVVFKVQKKLTELFSDPRTLKAVNDLGDGISGAFDEVIKFADGVDWGSLADGLKSAAGWAKRLFDAFQSLPPETKGLILAIGGFTKLTGGAPIKIAVDFAKDALGGVFGHFFDRGSSPANPMFVSGTGIGGNGPNEPGGGGSSPLNAVPFVLSAVAVGQIGYQISESLKAPIVQAFKDAFPDSAKNGGGDFVNNALTSIQSQFLPGFDALNHLSDIHLDQVPVELGRIADFLSGHTPSPVGAASNARPVGEHAATTRPLSEKIVAAEKAVERAVRAGHPAEAARLRAKLDQLKAEARSDAAKQKAATEAVKAKQQASLIAFRAGERAQQSGNSLATTANARLEAIKNKRTKFTVNNTVNVSTRVSVSDMTKAQAYRARVTRTTSLSAGDGYNNAGK